MSITDALILNPQNLAPVEILRELELITVYYYGFDLLLHRGQIVIHKKLVEDIRVFFDLAKQIKFPIEKVVPISHIKYRWNDELSCADNNSSGFNYRFIACTDILSKHARGCAFDVNPVQNVYIKYDENCNEIFRIPAHGKYNKEDIGTLVSGHPLVKLMKDLGWEWGGDWTPESGCTDYQHFQKILFSSLENEKKQRPCHNKTTGA